jgi:hypothetical protein
VSDEREMMDLAYIDSALHRLTTEIAGLRDDMKVLTKIVLCRRRPCKAMDWLTAHERSPH